MKKYLAELIGTFVMVLCGTGAIVLNDWTGGAVTHLGVSLAFGVSVMAMIYAFGAVSGAHINPAVTIGFWLTGRFPGKEVLPYCLSQFTGGILASSLLWFLFPFHDTLGATLPAGSAGVSFGLELALTLILMLVILLVVTGPKNIVKLAAILIGGTVFLEAYFGGPISGASMNPARSLGPALLSGHLEHLWIYFAAPVIGAAAAMVTCRTSKSSECCAYPNAFCEPASSKVG